METGRRKPDHDPRLSPHQLQPIDLTGSPFTLFWFPDNRESNSQSSLESRYNLPITDALNFNAGIYYYHSIMSIVENRQTSGAAATPLQDTYTRGLFHQNDDSAAGFLDVDYKPLQDLTLSAGGRYTWERKTVELAPLVNCVGVGYGDCALTNYPYNKDWRDFSPRIAGNYQITPQSLVYADWTRGFRSGNFNYRITTPLAIPPANPEKVTSYEFGSKNDFFDKTLRVNLALFWEDYKDIQQVVTANQLGTVVQSLLNVASATIKGVEVETTWEPITDFVLQGSGGWISAKYNSISVPLPGVDPAQLKFARVPEWTAFVSGTKRFRISAIPGKFSLRASYDWRSGYYDDFTNTPELFMNGYGLVDANLSYEPLSHWKFSLFGRNLANTYYSEQKGRNFAYVAWGGQPRTYGAEVSFHY